ncbi:MAG TPA: YggS family pyridoxal phosphate-dependent enzyme [Candidatus Baltobacteraceae bacterium]|nr:YggS family pyridoxal phosphate-dependent enzyme [Candidatus Baltobacteraceae bacterium]
MKLEVGAAPVGAPSSLAGRIATLRGRIAEAAVRAGRDPASIDLVGITKAQPRESVVVAIAAGLNDVGENYVQEAREKYLALPRVRKHFVGHVQTNKARAIVELFDVVQSIDRFDAGRAIARAQRELGKRTRTLLQVNVSPAERFGVAPDEAAELAARLREEEGLQIDGVMAIAPAGGDRLQTARAFERAARTFHEVGGTTLSLGMSADWEEAIAHGSTMLRIGTAIFGARL